MIAVLARQSSHFVTVLVVFKTYWTVAVLCGVARRRLIISGNLGRQLKDFFGGTSVPH